MTRPGRLVRRFVACLALAGALAPAAAHAQVRGCTPLQQNLFVRDVMTDLYLWYREVPDVNLTAFNTPEAYLEAVRYRPLDQTFSYITSRQANDALFSNSQFIGFGFSTLLSGSDLRVTQVFADSPAQEIGMARGARVLEINGRTVSDIVRTGEIGSAFGPAEVGVASEIVFERDASVLRGRMMKRLVTIPTVSATTVLTVDGRKIGYVFLRNFVEPSYDALDRAFATLKAEQAGELVLDLRYNGGGLVDVAQHLASLIGGVRTNGQVFAEYFHNDRNTTRNRALRFEPKANALTLDRVVVITTRSSASASELVINALRPFMDVWIVGDRTYGKPVGQYAMPFCDKVLAAVSFALRNADGQGDFFDGLQPDCPAPDDIDHQFGDPLEGSLREALAVIATNRCSPAATAAAGASQPRAAPRAATGSGWQTVVGAH